MRFFDRTSALLLVLFCLPLLFLPKINIIKISAAETAGLRADDFILFLFSIILLWVRLSLNKSFSRIEIWMLALVGFSLISFATSKFFYVMGFLPAEGKIFYCFRIFEYFMFFYVGTLLLQLFSLRRVLQTFFLWNFTIMILQKFGIIGEFNSSFGYVAEGSYRTSGIASFPSEMGALLNLLFCYFLFDDTQEKKLWKRTGNVFENFLKHTKIYWMFLIFAILIILTGSRIALVALLIPFLFRLRHELKTGSLFPIMLATGFLLCFGLTIAFVISKIEALVARSSGLLSWRNVELIASVWEAQNINLGLDSVVGISYEGHDLSWWIRIHKWCYALKMYCYHPECYLQGLGPGFAWAALDGGLLRILVEYGLIGCLIFWKLFTNIGRQTKALKWMVIAFSINMIFFDTYLAYKPMSLLFLVAGYCYAQQHETKKRLAEV